MTNMALIFGLSKPSWKSQNKCLHKQSTAAVSYTCSWCRFQQQWHNCSFSHSDSLEVVNTSCGLGMAFLSKVVFSSDQKTLRCVNLTYVCPPASVTVSIMMQAKITNPSTTDNHC